MTPTEVWENFDANLPPLEISTVFTNTTDNLVHTRISFLADGENGLRTCADVFFDDRWVDKRSAVLVLPSLNSLSYDEEIKKIVGDGFIACVLDYCAANDNAIPFPNDLKFACVPECSKYLDNIPENARHTPWFIWAKIARRAISALQSLPYVDEDRISLLGLGAGAEIGWIVAGIDKRVYSFVAINGGGYRWAHNDARFANEASSMQSDEQQAFSAGVGAETYAKFISCPTVFVNSRYSRRCDVDRAGDMLDLVKSSAKQLIVSSASEEQIETAEFDAVLNLLKGGMTADKMSMPTIAFETAENKLYVHINTSHKAIEKNLYVSFGEPNSAYRFWQSLPLEQKVGTHEYTCNIPVEDENDIVVCYATFKYADGNIGSTKVIGIRPSKHGVVGNNEKTLRHSRIIYDGSMGNGSFIAQTRDAIIEDDCTFTQHGPFGIVGISAKKGNLSLCRSAREKAFREQMSALHFDVYSPVKRNLEVAIYVQPDFKKFTARTQLQGGEFWQKVLLEYTDFKSEEGKTLPKFSNTKVLSIIDVEGLLLNNFLWI